MTAGAMILALLLSSIACTVAASGIPAVDEFTVDGIQVLHRRDVDNDVVAVILFLRGGVVNVRDGNPLIEEMSLILPNAGGPSDMSKELYRRKLSEMSTVISGSYGRDYSVASLVCVREYFTPSWDLFARVLQHPSFDEVEFDRIRRQAHLNLESRRALADNQVDRTADSLFFLNHLYSREASPADVDALTLDSIRAYHESLFIKSRMLLVVVGNISRDDLEAKIRATIATFPEGNYLDYGIRVPAKANSPGLAMVQRTDLPTLYIEGYFSLPKQADSDYWPSVLALSILNSHLFDEIRTRRNLTYAVSAEIMTMKLCFGKVSLTTEFPDSCIRIIHLVMQDLESHTPSVTELNYHRNLWVTQLGVREETNISQAEAIGKAQIASNNWRNAYLVITNLNDVVPADVQRCCQRYFHNMNFAVVGDTAHIRSTAVFNW